MQNRVRDLMTENPSCCTPSSSLNDVATQMVDHDCGAIPVVNRESERFPIGMITDRDIVCRAVARTLDLQNVTVQECMTQPCITIAEDTAIAECCDLMEAHRIRRVVVVDQQGHCVGIVAQADIARHEAREKTGEVVKKVSHPDTTIAA